MKNTMKSAMALCLASSLLGCTATVGTTGAVSVPRDAATTCATHCSGIGLALDSVVIMANSVGCVCRGAKGTATRGEACAAGGMAVLIAEEEQRQQQNVQQQQRR